MARLAVPSTLQGTNREIETRLRELDRKTASSSAGVDSALAAARHHWHGSGLVDAGGIVQALTSWTSDVDDGIATLSSGLLLFNVPGRWSVWLQYVSDATESGNSAAWLEGPSAALSPWGPFTAQLRDERLRGSGYALAGNLTQSLTWSGVVTTAQASAIIRPRVLWRSATGAAQANASWMLTAHYLGAAHLPS
jgi:hypothetical protein